MKNIISQLKQHRQNSGITQSELAAKTGIPRTTISKIEAGFRNTTLKTLFSLSQALNLDLSVIKKTAQQTLASLETKLEVFNNIEIYSSNILANYDYFQKLNSDQEIWPVLKSNAYGHGIENIVKILKSRTCSYFVVDSYFEALQIWNQNPNQSVLLIGPTLMSNLNKLNLSLLTLSVDNLDLIKAIGSLNKSVKIHLKINTGMNRLGIKINELDKYLNLIKKNKQIKLEGVYSHLASSDSIDPSQTNDQLKIFNQVINQVNNRGFKIKYYHLNATAGCISNQNNINNAVRLGIGLYGYNPLEKRHPLNQQLAQLQPGLTFYSKIVHVNMLKKGDRVSYGGTYTAQKNMRVGVIPVGYYEYFDRKLSNRGYIKYKEKFLPIIGNICMNLSMVDLLNTKAKIGDEVEIISNNQFDKNSISNAAKLANTIPYEILTRINTSTRRTIV